ncbi:unnamed protein product [Rhizoctonia solani]|uniref:ubiquitinyl hydrolase 1 n=1 Tax=Rhizoctonia solani TaxID=456999 RepID=A0A8H3GAC1_9AGAM|nr:unnamed protein product [Rhizoctonia solani]
MDEKPSFELEQLVYHLFLPPKLPQAAPTDEQHDRINARLCQLITTAVKSYRHLVSEGDSPQWVSMTRMLDNLSRTVSSFPSKDQLSRMLLDMSTGDVLVLHIREQNAAVIVRRHEMGSDFEVFEVQPPTADVMSNPNKLVRAYPGCAARVPRDITTNSDFTDEVANFLVQMDIDVLDDSVASTKRAGSTIDEVRDSAHPHFIANLFIGVLRGLGESIEPKLVVKRIADEVCWKSAYKPWRRSPLWLIMRVAMHTSLDVKSYKNFMVYFLCQVLRSCLKVPEFPGELLYSMRVKLARRIYKVQTHIPIVITSIVENYFQAVQDILQKRWTRIQSEHAHRLDWHPELLDIKRATNLSIPTLYPYLQSIFDRVANAPKPHKPTFDPPNPLANTADFAKFDNKALSKAVSSHKFTALFDFEQSVQQHLSDWATQNLTNKLTSSIISSCITQYVRAAKELYVHDIVYQSRMALTVMELWMALDRSVTTLYPLILEYSPEIPKGYLEPLLLASSQDIERANTIEQYLARRHTSAEPSRPSVFSSRTSKNAFSIQYFRQSPSLQKLKQTIEQQATQRRNEKIKEMNRLNQEYNRLVDKAKSSVCIQSTGTRQLDKQTHRKECTKCIATRKSNKMKIKLYEWPLPENDLEAEMVVFELRCPKPISLWRDMTYMILHNVGEVEVSDPVSPLCYLDKYDGLSSWSTELKQLKPRIGQASAIKSFVQSHYHSVKLPTSEGKVCVNNSLKFQPYDSLDKLWVSAVCSSLAKCGTFSLPENSLYKHLSFTLGGTAHTPNEVIASQFECPPELSLHEHIAFGSLRSGPHLQWLNILRGMEEGILSFGRYEVSLLHAQAAWQLGPLSEVVCTREWHVELAKPDFAEKLVSRALRLLGRVRSNWLESTTVGTCVLLVQRVLASQKDLDGATGAREFLIEAINVAFTWVGELTQKLESTVDDSQAQLYRQHLCEIAAVCRSAYNVPPNMLLDLLSNQRGCSPLIVCGIILYENRPQDLGSVPHNLQTLLSRDRILSHRLAPFLMDHILAHPSLLHDSISYVWPAFSPQTGGWVQETHSRSLWLTSTTSLNGRSMQKVDFNLGEGRLLINGLPIGRIPVEYANHPLYVRLFGKRVIEIVPSVIPGMTFTSRSEIEGYQVSFALNSANQGLIIQARADATILELIPPSKLEGDFPSSFSSNFHHWLNVQEKYVEFRPLSKPWSSDKQAWRLCVRDSGLRTMTSTMAYETCSLLDIRSFTYKEISRQLSGLETRQHIHITYSLSSRIRVNLPRFHLTFFLNSDNQLESLNFPEQVVDREQSSGTMIGLSSQLVLRRQDSLGMNQIPRMVIVPEGDVIFATHGHHVKVVINHDNNQHIGYHHYNIDSTLGCLSNSSGLTSRLFRIYLHALTSYCLVDPLTHRTGTEEALQLLSEPATSSFDRLNEAQAQLLGLIGKLTPLRTYYPIHLKCMQSTTWMNLPMFSQHNAFVGYAKSIIGHAGQLQALHPHEDFEFNQYLGQPSEEALHHRATLRDPEFYPTDTAGISGSAFVQKNDLYFGRDVYRPTSKWSTKEDLASWVTDLAKTHWVRPAYTSYNLVSRLESYGAFHGVQQGISLSYSSQWLSIILESWLSVYHVCRKASVFSRSPFALSFCLSAAAYTDGLSPEIALALISIATNPRFRKLHPPGHAQYNLQDGYKPTHTNVVELVLECSKYPVIISNRQTKKKKKQVPMNDTLSVCATKITESALKQWPNYRPGACAPFAEQFDMEKCNDAIQKYFASCSRNLELRDHLDQVQRFLPDSSGAFNLSLPTAWLAARDLTQLTKHSWDPQLCYDYPPSFNTLFLIRDPPLTSAKLSPVSLPPMFTCHNNRFNSTPNTEILENMLREFSRDKMHLLNRRYGADLEASRRCFVAANHAGPCTTITLLSELYLHLDECDKELNGIYNSILASLAPRNIAQQLLASSGIWPRLSPRNILKKLGLHHRASVPQNWIELLADYGLKLIALQRAIRLVYLGAENKHEEIQREIDSTSKNDTLARKNLDWILIQIEGNFSIRNLQAQIALEMISPSSGKNSLMQLNMGEGKSSVIIPVDVPSLRAEFGHPDVTILLTCLSYYYKGLSEAQLASCFEMIYKLDNPALEYDHWVLHCGGVPREYATLQGINIKDIKKFQRDIVPLFSYNSAVINFYLSALVFPRSIKEFPHKLVSSAWDLAVVKTHPTTGFSGTNDNRYLLPTTIAQVDPLNQSGTNALILNLLLQPENDHFQCVHISGGIASARDFVDSLAMQSPIIDVLLDVGAQMLDMTNEELARYWLGLRPDALAAVYFNDNDELLVLSQDEGPSRLITSPFAQRLDKCIVYLDDSHTRGTDLKLPRDARGAVTLGPKVTKDRLAQGCMRMRKLGRGQSVMFFAPLEIDNQIRQAVGALEDRPIQTYDVLRWAMLSTCNDLKHHVGHWVQQGQDYGRRLWHEKQYKITGDAKILKSGWLQSESRSVETLYGAVKSSAMTHDPSILEDLKLCERLQYLGVDTIEDSSWDEQQEREVSHEIELERQVERPLPVRPAQHSIHTDLVKMVKTGYFPQNSSSLCSLLELPDTDCKNRSVQNGHLFATVDFVATTLESDTSTVSANYMRPINWIISGFGRDLVILSPYEANALLPQIRSGSAVTLHVYAPRVTNYMVTFSDLNFYHLSSPSFIRPRSTLTIDVRIQLILASGQLYLDDYRQYLAVCVFLGLYVPNSDDATDFVGKVEISSDGFVNPAQRKKLVKYRPEYASCRFKNSPVSMLKDLIGKRRMGMDYMRTHLGQILHGRLLTPEDFN